MKQLYQDTFTSVEEIKTKFEGAKYICSDQIATCVYIAHNLQKPVMVEGPAGVGKTELAKTTAQILDVPLVRLQCYEGLDESKALYEWKYAKQLLYTQLLKDKLGDLLGDASGLGTLWIKSIAMMIYSSPKLSWSHDLYTRPYTKNSAVCS